MDLARSAADVVWDQVPGFIVGIITGLITGVLIGLWVAKILDRRKRRDQVRLVTASVTKTWAPVPGNPDAKVLTGGSFTVRNNSEWPIAEVNSTAPQPINMLHVPYLGPGCEHSEPISVEALQAAGAGDLRVTLQLRDVRGRL